MENKTKKDREALKQSNASAQVPARLSIGYDYTRKRKMAYLNGVGYDVTNGLDRIDKAVETLGKRGKVESSYGGLYREGYGVRNGRGDLAWGNVDDINAQRRQASQASRLEKARTEAASQAARNREALRVRDATERVSVLKSGIERITSSVMEAVNRAGKSFGISRDKVDDKGNRTQMTDAEYATAVEKGLAAAAADPWESYKRKQAEIAVANNVKTGAAIPGYLAPIGPEPVRPGPVGVRGPIAVSDLAAENAQRAKQKEAWADWNHRRNVQKDQETSAKADWMLRNGGWGLMTRARAAGAILNNIAYQQGNAMFKEAERVRLESSLPKKEDDKNKGTALS